MSLRVIDPRGQCGRPDWRGRRGALWPQGGPAGHRPGGVRHQVRGNHRPGHPGHRPRGVGAHPQPPLPPGRGRPSITTSSSLSPCRPERELLGLPAALGGRGHPQRDLHPAHSGVREPICQRLAQEAQPLVGGSLDASSPCLTSLAAPSWGRTGRTSKSCCAPSP